MSDRDLANLRAPPLLFGRRPPQSNYPPDTVHNPDKGPMLEHQTHTRVVFQGRLHTHLATAASKPPTYPTHVGFNVSVPKL